MAWKKYFNKKKKSRFNKPYKRFIKKDLNKKEELKKQPWYLPPNSWKTFIKLYETFSVTKKRFELFSFNNTLSTLIQMCDLFYEQLQEIPNEHGYVHISANDKRHVDRLGSSSRSHNTLKMALHLGVIQLVDSTVNKKASNCMYKCRKTLYKRLKALYNITVKWNDTLYKEFVEHYKVTHDKWFNEKQAKLKAKMKPFKSKEEKTKHFFKNMELSSEGNDIKGFIKPDYRPLDNTFKIDWNNDYKKSKEETKTPDTEEICNLLISYMEAPETEAKNCVEEELFKDTE